MSLDIEYLANWYRQQFGDQDIAEMLENAAQVSRRRSRPDRAVDRHAKPLQKEGLNPEEYFLLQGRILDVFMGIAPAAPSARRTTIKENLPVFRQFHEELGKDIGGHVYMRDLLMPGYYYFAPLTHQQEQELRAKMTRVSASVRESWNRAVYQMSSRFRGVAPLSYYRQMTDGQILGIKNVGEKSLQVFRTALCSE